MSKQTRFIAHIGLGDHHDVLSPSAIRSIIEQSQVPIVGVGGLGKSDHIGIARLFPTIVGDRMIEVSITLESNFDFSRLKVGDKLDHSIGVKLIEEDEL